MCRYSKQQYEDAVSILDSLLENGVTFSMESEEYLTYSFYKQIVMEYEDEYSDIGKEAKELAEKELSYNN